MTDHFLIGWLMVLIVRIWTNLDQSLRENNKKLKKKTITKATAMEWKNKKDSSLEDLE